MLKEGRHAGTPRGVAPFGQVDLEFAEDVVAQRDKSQGFGFVYVDINALLKRKESFQPNFSQPVETNGASVVNLPKRAVPTDTKAPTSTEIASERNQAILQIKDNLDRLQNLHHKLHAMLEELNQISRKK